MSSVPAPIPDAKFVEAVARRVVELLEDGDDKGAPPREGSSSLTVAEVAARYGVSRSWVYAHQRELGAMRLGSGPRARLRFNSTVVANAISAFACAEPCRVPDLEATRRRAGIPLIPFKPMG
jgi:hypothetical protein